MEHYAALDFNNLLALIDQESSNTNPKVTIYFSVPHASDFAMFGHAELRSLIQRAARRMTFAGATVDARLEIEASLYNLVTNPSLWEHRVDGYAIFASRETVRCYGLPREMRQVVVVSDSFYIRPLVPLLTIPHSFYVVEVSLGHVRLVRVMPQLLVEVPLVSAAHDRTSLEEKSIPIHNRNFHTSRITHGMSEAGIVVPHGGHEDQKHAQGKRYLQQAAHLIDQELRGEHVPIILVGTESARGHFAGYLNYKHVINNVEDLHVPDLPNHAARDASQLWQRCARIVQRWQSDSATSDSISEFYALEAVGRANHTAHEIRELATTGKVQTLLLCDAQTMDGNLTSEEHDENEAIIDTLRHGGNVVEVDSSRFHYQIGAILRQGAYLESVEEPSAATLS